MTHHGPNFLMLEAAGATVKVSGLPQEMEGWAEVRGVTSSGAIAAEEFTRIQSEVDIETHLKLVQMYEHVDFSAV